MSNLVEYVCSQCLLSHIVVRPLFNEGSDDKLFNRTLKNLNKMISEGRKCILVSPAKQLNSKEIEQYRRFFCKKAKEDKVNYVYFTIPVKWEYSG